MDRDNHAALQSLRNGRTDGARIVMMCDFARGHDEEEVPDPYYGGEQGFEKVLDLLEDACEGLLEEVRKY
jgi:protein-tyrosine phosphatase